MFESARPWFVQLPRCIRCRALFAGEVGRYQGVQGMTRCTDCDAGDFNPSRNQEACQSCPAGQFSNRTGQTFCHQCENAQYQDQPGRTRCEAWCAFPDRLIGDCCSVRLSFLLLIAQTMLRFVPVSCPVCSPPRTFSAERGLPQCRSCGTGRFNAFYGQTACQQCDIGKFQARLGQLDCDDWYFPPFCALWFPMAAHFGPFHLSSFLLPCLFG